MAEEKPHQPSHATTAISVASPSHVALIVGVTGITGFSLAESLRSPSSPGAPWTVYGAARRPPPPWFPLATIHRFLQLDALDPTSTLRTLSPLSHITHLFWVAATAAATIADNVAMLTNVLHSLPNLRHVALETGSMHYLPPLTAVDRRLATSAPFCEDSPRGTHPFFYYALEDVLKTYSTSLTWTVHRPSAILGASARSNFNLVLTLAAYALICRREGSLLVFPGIEYTWHSLCCDASDAGMLAEQLIWAAAAGNAVARNEAFNSTNGDVFAWRSLWEVVAGEFGVEHVARGGERWEWVARMKGKRDVWDLIVEEEELVRTGLDEIANFDSLYAITNFEFEMVSCMRKSREFGFDRRVDTMDSVKRWIGRLREMNIIPKH